MAHNHNKFSPSNDHNTTQLASQFKMDMPGGAALTGPNTQAIKHATGFLDLPAELRNQIYTLSGCLKALQCRTCNSLAYADSNIPPHREDIASYEKGTLMIFRNYWRWQRVPGPSYIASGCCLKTQQNRVHDLNFTYHKKEKYHDENCGFAHRHVQLWINRRSSISVHHNIKRTKAQQEAGKLPAIARTCKRLRAEALSILIATHRIYATVFDAEIDGADILRTFSLIGAGTAANIKGLKIVYSKKKHLRYIKSTLMDGLKAAGVCTEEAVVETFRFDQTKPQFVGLRAAERATRYGYRWGLVHQRARKVGPSLTLPMCTCEYCVVSSLRAKNKVMPEVPSEEEYDSDDIYRDRDDMEYAMELAHDSRLH